MRYLILALLWIAWCAVHSLLISLTVTAFLRRRLGDGFRYYRFFFNGFSAVTLIPAALYGFAIRSEPLFKWEGPFRIPQLLLIMAATFLFASALRNYDVLQFLGVRQVKRSESCAVLTEDCKLDTTGILGVIRHPWYLGGMIIVWARPLDISAIITNTIITGYFIVGAILEERKLRRVFGDAYREYQEQVSMFFPCKWLKARFGPGRG